MQTFSAGVIVIEVYKMTGHDIPDHIPQPAAPSSVNYIYKMIYFAVLLISALITGANAASTIDENNDVSEPSRSKVFFGRIWDCLVNKFNEWWKHYFCKPDLCDAVNCGSGWCDNVTGNCICYPGWSTPETGCDTSNDSCNTTCACEAVTVTTARDCYSLMGTGAQSGPYIIRPDGTTPVMVVCDMDTEDGGWTVIQQRLDGSVEFFRYWADYVAGFGCASTCGEYWLGLDWIHLLTTLGDDTEMYIWMEAFDGESRYARFSSCSIANTTDKYRLDVSGYVGTAGIANFGANNHQKFTTQDNDNDIHSTLNCATFYRTAGWESNCHATNPNGHYFPAPGTCPYGEGISWYDWRGHGESMKKYKIMLRRK